MSPDLSVIYPLGYLSTVAFGLRFFIQWLYSESKGKSLVLRPFWWLSLVGNVFLLFHSLAQMQFHVAIVQVINGVISWRNLDLMRPEEKQRSLSFTLCLMAFLLLSVLLLFIFFLSQWFRVPNPAVSVAWGWHIMGILGVTLFSSRFIVQWWEAEKKHQSILGPSFWWMSIIGGTLSIVYFFQIHDPVNLIGPSLGMIPYIRNLMLQRKKRAMA